MSDFSQQSEVEQQSGIEISKIEVQVESVKQDTCQIISKQTENQATLQADVAKLQEELKIEIQKRQQAECREQQHLAEMAAIKEKVKELYNILNNNKPKQQTTVNSAIPATKINYHQIQGQVGEDECLKVQFTVPLDTLQKDTKLSSEIEWDDEDVDNASVEEQLQNNNSEPKTQELIFSNPASFVGCESIQGVSGDESLMSILFGEKIQSNPANPLSQLPRSDSSENLCQDQPITKSLIETGQAIQSNDLFAIIRINQEKETNLAKKDKLEPNDLTKGKKQVLLNIGEDIKNTQSKANATQLPNSDFEISLDEVPKIPTQICDSKPETKTDSQNSPEMKLDADFDKSLEVGTNLLNSLIEVVQNEQCNVYSFVKTEKLQKLTTSRPNQKGKTNLIEKAAKVIKSAFCVTKKIVSFFVGGLFRSTNSNKKDIVKYKDIQSLDLKHQHSQNYQGIQPTLSQAKKNVNPTQEVESNSQHVGRSKMMFEKNDDKG